METNDLKPIMLGLINDKGYEKDNRVYYEEGVCPVLTIGGDPKKVLVVTEEDDCVG